MPNSQPDLSALIPVRTVSEANQSRHEHWTHKRKRAKEHRDAAYFVLRSQEDGLMKVKHHLLDNGIVRIRLTRIAPRELDDDNLRSALKHVRDGVTDALGLSDDRDPRLIWEYGQTKGKPKQYAVEVQLWRV